MTNLPSGTVTFLFTDIEGSTQLWEKYPEEMKSALAKHDAMLKEAIESNHGHVIKTTGDGIHAVFEKAIDAIQAALTAQRELNSSFRIQPASLNLKVRMGVHTGEAELRDADYYGQALNRAARIMAAGHGGQILLSGIVADLVREHLPTDATLHDLGEHRLKDLIRPERIFQLLADDLPHDFPLLKSLNTLPNNLPLQLTSFIGREKEMQETSKLITSARLLTLIGPGGTGKTRLSLQIAAEQFSNFKDGVWLVELAPLTDPAYIITAVATVFELHEVQNVPITTIVLDYLRAKQLLLILDNCEHLIEASAQLADQILHSCAQVKIIASSREALGVNGESVYRVPSLLDNEASRLFVDRATKADSRFKLTEHNASAIAQICSRLDGIPLAIELAAARVKLFSAEQIAERLDDRFKLLTGGSRTALPRQQTLRALIDWSYQTLNGSEQRALRCLATFSGGWSFEGAEAVIGESEAMDSLLGLVNKSLVNVEEQETDSRYRFLETIRQYAMERLLESGEAMEARNAHMDYFVELAENSQQKMFGSESQAWLNQMEMEHDNIRAALEWAASKDILKAIRLALAIGGFWTSRDYNNEAYGWCQTILERTQSLAHLESERAQLYALMGWTSITIGNHKAGRAAAEAGLVLARQVNHRKAMVRLLIILGLSSTFLGDFETARRATEEAETLARQENFIGELAMLLSTRSQVVYFTTKDPIRAMQYLQEAVALGKQAGFQWATSMAAYGAGRLAGHMGEVETARARFTESAEISKRFGNRRIVFSSRSELAHVLREHGAAEEALSIYREVIPGWKELGHRAAVAHELECISYILIQREEPEHAATLLGAAEALRQLIDTDMTNLERAEYERKVSALRAGMDEAGFQEAWNKGRSLSMDEAIELAIQV